MDVELLTVSDTQAQLQAQLYQIFIVMGVKWALDNSNVRKL
jgi:hypothetical protein